MSNDQIIDKLGYCRIAVEYDRSKVDAIDNAIDIIDSLDKFLMDLKKYELDCALTADGQCAKCNETMFKNIYHMLEKNFGTIDVWHNEEK